MVSVALTITFTILSLVGAATASNFLPGVWALSWNIPLIVSLKWGNKASCILAAGLGTCVHIYDVISECTEADGAAVVRIDCANSVISSAFGIGLAVLSAQSAGSWTRRETVSADVIFRLLPDSVKITDAKLFGEPNARKHV